MFKSKKKLLEKGDREKIRSRVYDEAEEVAAEVERLIRSIRIRNDLVVDTRLDKTSGLLEVLEELRMYSIYVGTNTIIYVNSDLDRKGQMVCWFEV